MLTWVFISGLIVIIAGLMAGLVMLWKIPYVTRKQTQEISDIMISIIIPARNEEERIKPLLESIALQQYSRYELIVVDDDSADQTAHIARQYHASVRSNNTLQDGWIGKSSACWTGANHAQGDYLLFLDADTRFTDEESLGNLVSCYQEKGSSGILSLQPYHTIERFYENLSAVFNIIVMAGMNVFTPFREKLEVAGSFGPCILCAKEDYFRTGGHEKIREAVMDDLALGSLFKEKGMPVRCYSGRGVINFQMYPDGIRPLVEGWSKSFATASQSTHPLVMGAIISWISGGFISFPFLVTALFTESLNWIICGLIVYFLYMLQLYYSANRTGSFHFVSFLFFPCLFLFFSVIFGNSLYLTYIRHTVNWRGRKIKV
ncbi:glycosyltransferase family 2 protein [Gracilibacillus salinarum]|uniref:4,4'-diaponeurosporenoate glycosyltransferase n=1 Tax=Gracilibacillus salinarum TaxID=2932255 RepID=A0ABY4GK89_9BACI|nr:glycosyltransferase family 2 protein [Gracilibacillus salinarum]UOQ84778.1 glycosyltransferase family 2 protein [Gracilibacillus salinarum]